MSLFPCTECGGEGRIWTSKYGGNDPDVWDAGPCEQCGGSGNMPCEHCTDGIANQVIKGYGHRKVFVCDACYDEELEHNIEY